MKKTLALSALLLGVLSGSVNAKNIEFPPYGYIDEMPYAMGQCFNNIIDVQGNAEDYAIDVSFETVSALGRAGNYSGERCAVFLFKDAVVGAMESYFGTEEKSVWVIKPDGVHMYGPNGTYTAAMHYALSERAHKKVLFLHEIEGSFDDDVNLVVTVAIRHQGYNTVLPSGGTVASGGADFFLGGVKRAIQDKFEYGVHSWGGPDGEGSSFPREHHVHEQYIQFYRELGIDVSFYWFTLESASADDIHLMTRSEMDDFNLVNATFDSAVK